MGYQELMDTKDPADYTIDLDTHMVFSHSHSIPNNCRTAICPRLKLNIGVIT